MPYKIHARHIRFSTQWNQSSSRKLSHCPAKAESWAMAQEKVSNISLQAKCGVEGYAEPDRPILRNGLNIVQPMILRGSPGGICDKLYAVTSNLSLRVSIEWTWHQPRIHDR